MVHVTLYALAAWCRRKINVRVTARDRLHSIDYRLVVVVTLVVTFVVMVVFMVAPVVILDLRSSLWSSSFIKEE